MPQGLGIPYSFTAETPALADQVNADFAAVQAKFNAGIVDGDLAAGADIDGNKLSQTSGKQIPTAALQNNAVDEFKLKFDSINPGQDALRAVSGDHIKSLTTAALTRFLPTGAAVNTTTATGIPESKLALVVDTKAFGPMAVLNTAMVVSPTGTYPVATYDIIGLFFSGFSITAGNAVNPLCATNTTNWSSFFQGLFASGTVSGTVTFIFMRKV